MTWLRDLGVLLGQKAVAEWLLGMARTDIAGVTLCGTQDASTIWRMSKLNRRVNNLLISPRPKQNEQCFTGKERRVEVPS